jgi:hypothetical protein
MSGIGRGKGAGTGTPISFKCRREARREADHRYARHYRTGRTKPNPSNNRGARVLGTLFEYECSCGFVGWTRHVDILYAPIKDDAFKPGVYGIATSAYGSYVEEGWGTMTRDEAIAAIEATWARSNYKVLDGPRASRRG